MEEFTLRTVVDSLQLLIHQLFGLLLTLLRSFVSFFVDLNAQAIGILNG
jgi:hypothetical protein